MRYIDVNDSEEVLRAIKLTDADCPIDLIVHTPGGLVLAAGQIAHALRRHRAKVTVFVPHYAMSGGTLIALAADEIVMDPNAVLGPVDPQLGESPAASILTVLERKKPEDIDDKTLILADVSRKAIAQVRRTVQELLSERMPPEQAAALADKLATGTWTHDYAIMPEEGKALGLPVSTEMPEDVYQFMSLFPQPTRTHPIGRSTCRSRTARDRGRPTAEREVGYETLAEAVDGLARRGFAEGFRVAEGGLRALGTGERVRARDLVIRCFYRFEGISDPDDMAIVYAVESRSGLRGTLVDAFGTYADPALGAVLSAIPVIRPMTG